MKEELPNIQKLQREALAPKHLVVSKIRYKKYWRKTSLKQKDVGDFFLQHILKSKPKNFLEIGVFHGVTSRNICDLLHSIHGNDFSFTGIDLFLNEKEVSKDEYIPKTQFSNPLKQFTKWLNEAIKNKPIPWTVIGFIVFAFVIFSLLPG